MADEAPEDKTYYLRPGKTHNIILKGENVRLDEAGSAVKLSEESFKNFRDKFFTETEYKAYDEEVTANLIAASNEGSTESSEAPEAEAKTAPETKPKGK